MSDVLAKTLLGLADKHVSQHCVTALIYFVKLFEAYQSFHASAVPIVLGNEVRCIRGIAANDKKAYNYIIMAGSESLGLLVDFWRRAQSSLNLLLGDVDQFPPSCRVSTRLLAPGCRSKL